ncbi:13291_t:CDS:2 [Funneliformis geosporum]|uniref:4244_t:CDS:1 n=1 Tax=Funneliformis geosporum TaxID=1117311 RepID=A0A9W4WYK0_9GLOM|nr:13291_t:CDS:2 [Funneliformis geosporum]CAI2173191.1 4244_t:CDS:2 [Funneliformis geosporum]
MALISIFGIIGAIFVTSKRIKLLESILRGAVTANIIIAFLVITNMIRAKQEAIDLCIQKDPSFLMDEGQRQIQNATESFENSVVNKLSNATSNDNTNESLSNYCRHHEIVRIWLRSIGLILSALFVLNFPPKLVERNVAGDSTDKLDTPSMT